MSSFFTPCLILSVLATMVTHAALDLDSWRKEPLGVASAGDNNWYFFPDSNKNPRVLVKATGTGATVNRRLLTDGPPAWTTGAAVATPNLNKQGVIVPFVNGVYLIAPHNNALRLTFLNAAGTATISEVVDNAVAITSVGLSAALDGDGALHIAYVGKSGTSAETLRYARRTASGVWKKSSRDLTTLSQYIRETVILPTGSESAKIYASLKTGTDMSLLRVSISNGNMVNSTGDGNLTPGTTISEHIAGNRLGGVDRVYYFAKTASTGTWNLKQVGSNDPIQEIGVALPTSILCKGGPDNKQRIVWLDGLAKKVHYLKPGTDKPFDVIHPVTGTTGTAEVRGLHFDASNKPFLLYRNNSSQGFIAFPDEGLDSDGNGRPDLLDVAFNSTTAGIEILPPADPVAGFPLSENKFKFRLPTIGSAISNGAGGLQSSSRNLTYGVETSTDALTWTPLGAGSQMFFVQYSATGTYPDELKTFTGIYNEPLPGASPKRFFRVTVKRASNAY